jgi:hypothetical protein
VQRLTHDLQLIGFLVEDGVGPRGTNKWKLPYNDGGDKLSPVTICRGDKNTESLGDIPSGDIPSGDKLTPELKEPEPINLEEEEIDKVWIKVIEFLKPDVLRSSFDEHISPARILTLSDDCIVIAARSEDSRVWLQDRLQSTVERFLVGVLAREVQVSFVVEVP